MKKFLLILPIASITTFLLFGFMAAIIYSDQILTAKIEPDEIIEIAKLPDKPKVHVKPAPVLTPPPTPRTIKAPEPVETNIDDVLAVAFESPGFTFGETDVTDGWNLDQDNQVLPIVRIPPRYPSDAALDGIEG